MLNKILNFLDGKKTKGLAIISVLISYMTATNMMTAELSTAILAVLNILAGGASYATEKNLGAKRRIK